MVRKKTRQVIWRWKFTTNHCQGKKYILEKNIYWKKKKRPTLSYQLKKKIKRHAIGRSKEKKTALGLLSYNAKSAQYQIEQNSNGNYLVSQELTFSCGIRYPDEPLRRNYSRLVPDSLSNYRYYIYMCVCVCVV